MSTFFHECVYLAFASGGKIKNIAQSLLEKRDCACERGARCPEVSSYQGFPEKNDKNDRNDKNQKQRTTKKISAGQRPAETFQQTPRYKSRLAFT